MPHFTSTSTFPEELITLPEGSSLEVLAVHYTNYVLLQLRLNGEMDCTVEVSRRGLSSVGQDSLGNPIAGFSGAPDLEDDADEQDFARDNMADYHVITKLGDPNDTKTPVIATQIAELYQRVILPNVPGSLKQSTEDPASTSLIVTLSSKIWRDDTEDFQKLVYVLQTIKEMYHL
ncbi:Irc25p KNAG_0M01770 [Huiozyma naganishii CBS 8797]|uniref:Proteasome chaperone 3 n=1 Tax=Huiozyma naganishii (strain ATCC MYA-139 / BCRC 22969 / CBS 8797 / KCTC 17520 / NBRC 10181 / NCYC 3082 / Yp74L-3) TaxID=1071383 RepID=J7RDW7_HUIN7|nr:hypothetical protein KNAG_0M01770 [Kazachstania naganishii CBS 8797]CCK73030.1 hypothetical protein KNAG_0M01770 [Kazachstania naganishii CBS 8797]